MQKPVHERRNSVRLRAMSAVQDQSPADVGVSSDAGKIGTSGCLFCNVDLQSGASSNHVVPLGPCPGCGKLLGAS